MSASTQNQNTEVRKEARQSCQYEEPLLVVDEDALARQLGHTCRSLFPMKLSTSTMPIQGEKLVVLICYHFVEL
jgi:hypothetical protein